MFFFCLLLQLREPGQKHALGRFVLSASVPTFFVLSSGFCHRPTAFPSHPSRTSVSLSSQLSSELPSCHDAKILANQLVFSLAVVLAPPAVLALLGPAVRPPLALGRIGAALALCPAL